MRLPPALQSWETELAEFPFEVAVAVGRLAQRMAALLGPLGHEFDQTEGDIDGYDGLTRRGLPERMLLSDWLLAEEAPDEWTRRAAENELSYLQLARKAPQVSRVIVAVFDAGPDVLGSPRLGQIAALVVMARRAREMNAELVWSIAQLPLGAGWHDVSTAGVNALLEARGSAPLTPPIMEEWRSQVGDCDECWLIGGRDIGEYANSGDSRLLLEDPFEAVRAIDVQVVRAHGQKASARLELPSDAIATRLLRDPFDVKYDVQGQVRKVKDSFKPCSNLVWLGGHSLAARSSVGGLLLMRVPSSPRGGVPKPKHFQSGDYINPDFVGFNSGHVVLGHIRGSKIHLHSTNPTQSDIDGAYSNEKFNIEPQKEGAWRATRSLYELRNLSIGAYKPIVMLPSKQLFQLDPYKEGDRVNKGTLNLIADKVIHVNGFAGQVLAVAGQNPTHIIRMQSATGNTQGFDRTNKAVVYNAVQEAFWGPSSFSNDSQPNAGILALQTAKGWALTWQLDGQERVDAVAVDPDEHVLGVGLWRKIWDTPGLLILSVKGSGLLLRGPDWEHSLVESSYVVNASISPTTPYIVWQTEDDLTVYSVNLGNILARWEWGGNS